MLSIRRGGLLLLTAGALTFSGHTGVLADDSTATAADNAKNSSTAKDKDSQAELAKSPADKGKASEGQTAHAAETASSSEPSVDDSAYKEAFKAGEAAYKKKDFDAASKAFDDALKQAVSIGKEDKRVPPVLNFKALIASTKRDYKGAIDLQKQAQAINTKVYGANSKQVAYDLAHLSLWYEANKQVADAETAMKQSVDVTEKALGKDDPALARSLAGLAEFYLKHQKIADAEAAYKRALEVDSRAGKDGASMELARKLSDLYLQQKNFKEADQIFQDEINREAKDLGQDSATLSVTLSSVADTYMGLGHYAQAEPLLRRAVSIQRMTMGDDHPITAATSASLALALSKEGKYQDAEPLYKLAIRVLSHTRQRQAVPEIMNEYANCLIKLGRKGEAANLKAQAQALTAAK